MWISVSMEVFDYRIKLYVKIGIGWFLMKK